MPTPSDPWAPYEPTADDPWNLRKVAHLHRRAGFGATWAELQRDVHDGPGPSVARLLQPRAPTPEEKGVLDALRQGVLASRDSERLKAWWLYRILFDPDPLREKLTLFWHSHFATSNRKVQSIPLMLQQNELLRRQALSDFAALLTSILRDGAMLVWLDGAGSKKAQPNENLAREFLELFTLGVGHYSETDIRQAARAFTGWVRQRGDDFRNDGSFHHDPAQLDAGEKTFLEQTGAWQAADIVRIALEQPAAAEFLGRKLYRFFISETAEPGPELIQPLAQELRKHQYSLRHVVGIILHSRHFYAQEAYRQRLKNPVEFSAGLLRMLEVPRAEISVLALAAACARQGQDLFYPPSVKGWEGGRTWLNSSTGLERSNYATDLVWGNPHFGLKRHDPLAWARRHGVAPQRTTEGLIELLLQDDLEAKARELMVRTGGDGSPDRVRKALQLVLHCPEFQLA